MRWRRRWDLRQHLTAVGGDLWCEVSPCRAFSSVSLSLLKRGGEKCNEEVCL